MILALTLVPVPAGEAGTEHPPCVICGERGGADALLNAALFLPLGMGLALGAFRGRRAILTGALLSGGVELLQAVIPGRYSNLGDVLTNTLGTASGFYAVVLWGRLGEPARQIRAGWSFLAAAAATSVMVVSGIALRPYYTRDDYYGQWTPNLGHLEWYRGRVRDARLDGVELPVGRLSDPGRVRELLLEGTPLQVVGTAGPPISRLGSLFSIYDAHQREIILVGPLGNDLVVRSRIVGSELLLDTPALVLPNALRSIAAGDSLRVNVSRSGREVCVGLNRVRDCSLGFTVANGWRLLYSLDSWPPLLKQIVSMLWLAGLVFPFGVLARRSLPSIAGALLLAAALLFIPFVGGVKATPISEWLAAVAGVLGGHLVRRWRSPSEGLEVDSA